MDEDRDKPVALSIRLPKDVHAELAQRARDHRRSLNGEAVEAIYHYLWAHKQGDKR